MLNVERRTELLQALRRGYEGDEDLDSILIADIDAIEPIIERWIAEMRAEFDIAVQVCMEQRGRIEFLPEYLPGGIFHGDVLALVRKP